MAKKETKEKPEVDNTVEKQKIKKKPTMKKVNTEEDGVTKVDLSKLKEAAENVTKVDLKEEPKEEKAIEEVKVEEEVTKVEEPKAEEEKEVPALEEVKQEEIEKLEQEATDAIVESQETGKPLPENVEKLVSFMEETGGDINDYVKLNTDYSEMDNHTLLKEYYKQSKPHLNNDEIDFLMEDSFSYDEDTDDEKEIRKKKIALKEQVASAKSHLEENKSKYYDEIKAGSKLTTEQQKAIDFFNRYNKDEAEGKKIADKQKSNFLNKTKAVFNDKFKGFEYNVGDKNYRVNVSNANEVSDTQSDINNFVKKFLNENGEVSDARGYHKSLYTAMNADAIAKHFYEQGKTDAMNDSITNAKNIDMKPRQSHSGEITTGGMKIKALGDDTESFKFKIKSKNK